MWGVAFLDWFVSWVCAARDAIVDRERILFSAYRRFWLTRPGLTYRYNLTRGVHGFRDSSLRGSQDEDDEDMDVIVEETADGRFRVVSDMDLVDEVQSCFELPVLAASLGPRDVTDAVNELAIRSGLVRTRGVRVRHLLRLMHAMKELRDRDIVDAFFGNGGKVQLYVVRDDLEERTLSSDDFLATLWSGRSGPEKKKI